MLSLSPNDWTDFWWFRNGKRLVGMVRFSLNGIHSALSYREMYFRTDKRHDNTMPSSSSVCKLSNLIYLFYLSQFAVRIAVCVHSVTANFSHVFGCGAVTSVHAHNVCIASYYWYATQRTCETEAFFPPPLPTPPTPFHILFRLVFFYSCYYIFIFRFIEVTTHICSVKWRATLSIMSSSFSSVHPAAQYTQKHTHIDFDRHTQSFDEHFP